MNYGADILAGLKRLEMGRERRFKLHRLKLTAIPTEGISWKRHAGKKHKREREFLVCPAGCILPESVFLLYIFLKLLPWLYLTPHSSLLGCFQH